MSGPGKESKPDPLDMDLEEDESWEGELEVCFHEPPVIISHCICAEGHASTTCCGNLLATVICLPCPCVCRRLATLI